MIMRGAFTSKHLLVNLFDKELKNVYFLGFQFFNIFTVVAIIEDIEFPTD